MLYAIAVKRLVSTPLPRRGVFAHHFLACVLPPLGQMLPRAGFRLSVSSKKCNILGIRHGPERATSGGGVSDSRKRNIS
jgi:hypothetical protein